MRVCSFGNGRACRLYFVYPDLSFTIVSKSFEIKSRCRCSRRTWLSHEDTARKSAAGENANPDTPSVGGEVSCNRQCIHSRCVLRSVSDSDLVLATVSYLKVFLHLLTVIVVPKQKEKTK